MEKAKNFTVWTEVGYQLFAEEGLEGIQVERVARILQLNKSGFYHYFGDLDGYTEELIRLHIKKADIFLADLVNMKSIDPEYLELMVKHKTPIMFHMQLIRCKDKPTFYKEAQLIDQKEKLLLGKLWSDYLGIHEHPELAIRYFNIVRDMLYARMSFQNMNYAFLQKLMHEAKVVIQKIKNTKAEFAADQYLV
jgi:AcrR family transcriptional regulator